MFAITLAIVCKQYDLQLILRNISKQRMNKIEKIKGDVAQTCNIYIHGSI